ncbi:MAG: lipoprotein-releasing ABC transporter permease subunit [Holosporaceae bacterium]|jgi:lipoprotein-releasing system permease protein|nr:lipoprotein-releasing ABC transporter permease subunit [Holosporaceae bacterium]
MLSVELLLAWRYLRSKRKERAISAIAGFSVVGIILGVATLIVVTSVMNGFRREFTERIIGFNGHVALHPISSLGKSTNYEEAVKKILSTKGVAQVIPVVERQALISSHKAVGGTLIYGISHACLLRKDLISQNIVSGNLEDFCKENAIILGESLAQRMGLTPGSDVAVISPEMDGMAFGFMPRKKTFKLVAVFNSGMYEYDNTVSYISLDMAQKLFKIPNEITGISVFVTNPMRLNSIKKEIAVNFSSLYRITDWQSNNSSFMKAVEIERNVMFLILTLITLVASFNIISCMIMLVKDKEKDVAILRTIGLSQSSVTRVFFMAGASLGIFGTFMGTLVGVAFSINIQRIQEVLDGLFNTKVFSPEVYFLTNLPSLLDPMDVLFTVSISLALSCLATIYPARKASQLNPTEILRYA